MARPKQPRGGYWKEFNFDGRLSDDMKRLEAAWYSSQGEATDWGYVAVWDHDSGVVITNAEWSFLRALGRMEALRWPEPLSVPLDLLADYAADYPELASYGAPPPAGAGG